MPETVIGWHRQGFRWYWTWKVRHGKAGRPPVPKQIRALRTRQITSLSDLGFQRRPLSFPLNCIDDIAASVFQMKEPALDAIPFSVSLVRKPGAHDIFRKDSVIVRSNESLQLSRQPFARGFARINHLLPGPLQQLSDFCIFER